MKKKSATHSAFFSPRVLIVFLLCSAAACPILIPIRSGLAFVQAQAPSNTSQRTLTFEERVSYQRAIEEVYWRRPITANQLQAEMNRMATHTKQPEVLQELFEALGNDPFVIAECLARPALAERLLTTWYAYDQEIHGDLKLRAEPDLQAHPSIGQI